MLSIQDTKKLISGGRTGYCDLNLVNKIYLVSEDWLGLLQHMYFGNFYKRHCYLHSAQDFLVVWFLCLWVCLFFLNKEPT